MINEFEASTEFKRHLKYIELRFLDYASLEELPSLEVLDAMRNRVKAFSIVNVFQRFKITESKSSLLSYFSYNELSTQWLNLSQLTIRLSDVASIDERLFDLFPKLEHLNLSCGEIGTIKAHVFAKASNLADLNLCGNKIICLEEQSFCGLQNLKTLAVSATNGISQTIAFAGLDKLENLDLSYSCSLATIDSSTFAWLPLGIKKLDLSFCSIHSIDSKSFDHLANLDELVLSSNRIQSFEMGQAAPRVLDVSNDNRLCLVKLTSKKVDKVEKMDLRFYNFGEIQLESSYRMSGLRKLRINPAREMKFDSLPFLESLTLMIKDLDYLNQGQLECLSCLKCLELDLFHSGLRFVV
jgi:Leucine-rich repeat (LRR) protein